MDVEQGDDSLVSRSVLVWLSAVVREEDEGFIFRLVGDGLVVRAAVMASGVWRSNRSEREEAEMFFRQKERKLRCFQTEREEAEMFGGGGIKSVNDSRHQIC
ncbi:hypothetical protein L1987_43902 [Smallanthus sonchifolius]|uniref:Uncharacterized protein n=1 Tax=Smallanthus sonchifolius TaxID=185202 RepID=A0ACB9GPZ9_9ASTR|nr:hypothetical protein L1987_43902 [Smallanthus sonchifolius]